ncbi:MAG TPA: hypothetical protein PJ988_13060 [Anaerolinea sp.]|nr:hypothetical protein [Anaerolinea sp.]
MNPRTRIIWLAGLALALLTGCVSASPTAVATAPPTATTAPAASPTTQAPTQTADTTSTGASPVEATPTEATATLAQPTATLDPAAACTSPAALTPALTEGPYFTPNSPEKASLVEPGMSGTRLLLSGYVFTTDCRPVANALLDFWQADAQGRYDNNGYTLRGHVFSDETGHYQIETIIPGEYPGRTEHIHVKVQAPGGPVLTSQLFIPGVAQNQSDNIFDPALVMTLETSGDGMIGHFNFVISEK